MIKLRTQQKFFLIILISLFLSPYIFSAQVDASVATFSDVIWVEEDYSTALEAPDVACLGSIRVDHTAAELFQGNSTGIIKAEQQMSQFSSLSSSPSFSRHLMCKDFDISYNPINPTTIFRPSDTEAVCLTTVSINDTIEFRWYYRSNSSTNWVSCYNWSRSVFSPGEHHFAGWFLIAGYWPGYHYPRAYKVEVYLDDSPSAAFSEFFEVTNGGLNSPRMCEDVDVNGNLVNLKSRFMIGNDTKAHHFLRFDKIAYFNEESGYCHNFTTVWIQPNGTTYKTYSGNFTDYKDTDVTWNYWEYRYAPDDYIVINSSTPVGNWKIEVYLDSYFNNAWMRYGPIATTPFIVGDEPAADWTFLVYLDADNNLERAGIDIFEKMANVGSSSQVNIVVQMDRNPGYNSTLGYDDRYGNWTNCYLFNVTKDMTPTQGNATLDLGEVNMGHPDTLKDFVNWTINNYPADYYFLVVWNHGTGCMGVCFDSSTPPPIDFLTLPELSQALSGLPAIMDVVLVDACSMSMTEVAYQIKDCANVLVGPEGLGWAPAPYDDYLSSLTGNSSMLPGVFARDVVTKYIEWCNSDTRIQNATMSATDLTKITGLTAAIDDFALKLKENEILYHEQISLARSLTEGYIGPYGDQSGYYIDLYHFAEQIYYNVLDDARVHDEEIRNSADRVMTTLESIIIIEDDKECPNSHGLSIFFPDEKEKYNGYKSPYEETSFAENTQWDEFVICHLDIRSSGYVLTIQTPYSGILISFDEESYETDAEGKLRVFVLPGSYTVTVPAPVYNVAGPSSRGVFLRWNDNEMNPSRTITVSGSITYTAYYETQYELTFSQHGIGIDFKETVATIDGMEYNATRLPVSFWWADDSAHTFGFQSPLVVTPNVKRYVWNYTSGLSLEQSDHITVSTSGSVIGNYETQFYLTLATSPLGVASPSGEGWHYTGIDASISTDEFIDITPGASRYRFNGWSTIDMTEISDQDSPSSSVRMDEAKTVTANYVNQYYLTQHYLLPNSPSPTSEWLDSETPITASVTSPWPTEATDTRYVCTGWTGTGSVSTSGTTTSVTFTIDEPSSVTWNWKTQYLLTVGTDPTGIGPLPTRDPAGEAGPGGWWYDNGTPVSCTAQKISGRVFDHWTVDEARWDPGVDTIAITMDGPYEATAQYERELPWWEILFSLEWLNFIIAFVGVALPVALLGVAWVRTRRKKGIIKDLLNKIDEVYSKFKMNRLKCEEELHKLRNTILEDLTNGKITQENYDIIDKKIEGYLEELRKK